MGGFGTTCRLQDAQFQELATAYQQTVLNADQEVEDGLATFLQAQQRAKSQAESVDDAEKAVVIVVAQYKAGTVDFTRVTQVQQNLVPAAGHVGAGAGRSRGPDPGLPRPGRRLADPLHGLRDEGAAAAQWAAVGGGLAASAQT